MKKLSKVAVVALVLAVMVTLAVTGTVMAKGPNSANCPNEGVCLNDGECPNEGECLYNGEGPADGTGRQFRKQANNASAEQNQLGNRLNANGACTGNRHGRAFRSGNGLTDQ